MKLFFFLFLLILKLLLLHGCLVKKINSWKGLLILMMDLLFYLRGLIVHSVILLKYCTMKINYQVLL